MGRPAVCVVKSCNIYCNSDFTHIIIVIIIITTTTASTTTTIQLKTATVVSMRVQRCRLALKRKQEARAKTQETTGDRKADGEWTFDKGSGES